MLSNLRKWLEEKGFDSADTKRIANLTIFFVIMVVIFIAVYYLLFYLEPHIKELFSKQGDKAKLHMKAFWFVAIIVTARIFHLLLNVMLQHYRKANDGREILIGSFINLLKVVVWIVGIIIIISVMTKQKSFDSFLAKLGIISAASVLVFKESILSFFVVVSIAISKSIMIGDTLEVVKYGNVIRGNVKKIGFTSIVIVCNKGEMSLPVLDLFSSTYLNKRNIDNKEAHLISSQFLFDLTSIKPISKVSNKNRKAIERYCLCCHDITKTNVDALRVYFIDYFKNLSFVDEEKIISFSLDCDSVKREFYFNMSFTTIPTDYDRYERVLTEINSHVLAVLPDFEIKLILKNNNNNVI